METSPADLLITACPSIQYRVRKEFLHQSPDEPEMVNLQNQIFQDDDVKEVINSQASDGWLAQTFHGYNSMEAGIRLLCEKGIESNQPVLARALIALSKYTDRLERGLGRVGKILDDLGFGGSETIRAHLFAHSGMEDNPFVQKQAGQALDAFRSVIEIESLEDLCQQYERKSVFRKGICWPGIYHLRLLAMTRGWRTLENQKMIVKSVQQLVHLSPIPNIYVRHKSQLIAPASFCMVEFTPDMNKLTDAQWMQWFHRMELLARLGVAEHIPELKEQVRILKNLLQAGHGSFTKKLNHAYFKKWGSYTGLMLEKDWKSLQRRVNDLTFRSLLILHHAGR